MNKLIIALSLLFSLIILNNACLDEPAFPEQMDALDYKSTPYDLFFFQRSYPDQSFDLRAYDAAIQLASRQQLSRSGGGGFDTAWKQQGPGNIGARVNTIALHPDDEQIIYAGFSTGGVFKTIDGGQNWVPIFDDQMYTSIGDITLDPQNPEIVYVGTGDPNISAYPFIGIGVYKSTNGGQSWTHMGLTHQRIVSRIVVDPSATNTVYVSCMGLPFERNNQRGVYKSTNGGSSWSEVLFLDDSTGIIDLMIDPTNPQTLYAAGWNRIRNNNESIISGPGAKIYKTTNGGLDWVHLSNGLPAGDQGRIGLCMSATNSQLLFASYVGTSAQLLGIYKSTDGGLNWTTVALEGTNGLHGNTMGAFGWYFGQLRVDPTDDNHLYLLGVELWQTFNGGSLWLRTNTSGGDPVHVDNHDLIFSSSGHRYLGTDGGLYKLPPGSNAWQDIENIPSNQFYRVGYNPHRPDFYYGGTQDNGNLSGNAATVNQWERLTGGDGFQPVFHPTDSLKFYVETQFGSINVTTNGGNNFFSVVAGIDPNDQRNWDMPYFMSPHRPDNLFTGTYRVYRAQNPSFSSPWQAISPDLTKASQSSSPNSFHTISCLDQSAVDSNLLYVGTTDGNVWKSENLGNNWQLINAGLPNRYITSIKADPEIADHVFITVSGYKYNDFTPLIYKSMDTGDSWNPVSGNLPQLAVNDLLIIPNTNSQQLVAATDGGVYMSLDGGQQWERLGNNMPFIPVYDLAWNAHHNEVIAGTFARSIMTFPLDSLNSDGSFTISGHIHREDGQAVGNVSLLANCGGQLGYYNNENSGDFTIPDVGSNPDCFIQPSKNINHRNGVSTFDIVIIQKHILGIEFLGSAYLRIAADINNSGTITTFDIVSLRKLILFIDTAFTVNESWRFVLDDFVFTDPDNPFQDNFPESYDCSLLNSSQTNVDFTAIKIGDVNQSGDPQAINSNKATDRGAALLFKTKDQQFKAGDLVTIDFQADDFTGIAACQFTFQFDQSRLSFLQSLPGSLSDFSDANFGNTNLSTGQLTFSWNTLAFQNAENNSTLFSLQFRALADGRLSQVIQLNSSLTEALAYQADGNSQPVQLEMESDSIEGKRISISLLKNPVNCGEAFTINLQSTFNAAGELSAFDINGIRMFHQIIPAFQNQLRLEVPAFPSRGRGMYFLQFTSAGKRTNTRLICQ